MVALQSSAAAPFSEATELEVLGKLARPEHTSLAGVGYRSGELAHVGSAAKPSDHASTDCGRCVIAFSGVATLEMDGPSFAVGQARNATRHVGSTSSDARCVASKSRFPGTSRSLVDGQRNHDHGPRGRAPVAPRRLQRLVAGALPRAHGSRGTGALPWRRARCLESMRYRPSGFRTVAERTQSHPPPRGSGGRLGGGRCRRPLPCERHGASARIDLSGVAPERWSVSGCSDERGRAPFPDPLARSVLLDPQGRCVLHGRLSVGRLAGYRLLSPSRATYSSSFAPRDAPVFGSPVLCTVWFRFGPTSISFAQFWALGPGLMPSSALPGSGLETGWWKSAGTTTNSNLRRRLRTRGSRSGPDFQAQARRLLPRGPGRRGGRRGAGRDPDRRTRADLKLRLGSVPGSSSADRMKGGGFGQSWCRRNRAPGKRTKESYPPL